MDNKYKTVTNNLLISNKLDEDFLFTQLAKIQKVDFADFYIQQTLSESWVLDEAIVKSGSYALNQGIGVRAVIADRTFMSYTNSLKPQVIINLTDNLFTEHSTHSIITRQTKRSEQKNDLYTFENPLVALENLNKINILKQIDVLARQNPYVINVMASINLEYDQVIIARNDNHVSADIRPLIHLSIAIILNKNGKIEKSAAGGGGRYQLNYFNEAMINSYIRRAYDQALLKVEAVACPTGKMPIVLGNGWAGVILHEAIGHGLEGDFNRKCSSAFTGKINQQVASKGVTIVDDGTVANVRGSLNIDDEGNPTQRTVLIEDGILKGYLYDEMNARLMGVESTGNGRRESFAAATLPRMTNTFMLNGSSTHEEIIGSVENGLYAENFEGGQVDIISGQFVFNASVAWTIKNGKLDYPVKGCALVGNGPECLKHVTMIGNDSCLDSGVGSCGKDGQTVPVGVGQPTIRLDGGLLIGG